MRVLGKSLASALGAALIASQIGVATAAPLPTNISAIRSSVASPTQVYWRGGWGGWGWGGAAIAGALIGGAIASGAYGYYGPPAYYYASPYSYGYYGYAAPYYGYYAPYPYYGYYARPYRVYHHHYGWHRHYRYW